MNDNEIEIRAERTHFRACNLCEAICGLEITLTDDNEILSIKGDAQDPFSKGHVCPKAVALKDIYHDSDRLKTPVKRTENGWQEISWNEAFDEIAMRLKQIQTSHGKDAVAIYSGNPSVHNSGTMLTRPNFIRSIDSKNNFSATSVDQLPHHFAAWLMFGHPLLIPVPDVDHTDFMLIMGANPAASNGSLMTAPGFMRRLDSIQNRGGKVVVVDPRKTATAKAADEHLFIQPSTDVYLLLSLARIILDENLITSYPSWIDKTEITALKEFVADFAPEFTEKITGISASDCRNLAKDLIESNTSVVYGRIGVSVQTFGGLCHWLINVINILTGNFDKSGGAMLTKPAIDLLATVKTQKHIFNRWQSKVRGLPEFNGELPVAVLTEEINAGNIKSLVTICGNPVLSTPNGDSLDKALSKLDFVVAIDIYVNETTRHADIILPTTTGLETAHYDLIFNHFAVRNNAKYSEPLFDKSENQRHDHEIFTELTNRLMSETQQKSANPETTLALGLQFGFYGKDGLSLQKLKDNPHGVDLGALTSCFPERLFTENKMVNLVPELLVNDLARARKILENSSEPSTIKDFDLLLIGRRQLRSNNSWMHNSERLMKGRNRCTLMINPQTAIDKGLQNQQFVGIESRVGKIEIAVEITDDIAPNVVSIPHGFGHWRDAKLSIASQYAGVSMNDLTDDLVIDDLTGNSVLSGVPVRIVV